jgi:trimethylamine--corrinoid protein Co-methyltransferase
MYMGKSYRDGDIEYNTLHQDQMKEIHAHSCKILEEIGMVVHHDGAREMLKRAGAFIKEGNKVFVPASLVEWALRSAPSRITMYNRDGLPALDLEDRNVYYGTGSDTLYLIDHETKERRRWRKKDVEKAITICDYLPHVDFVMSMGLISDVDIKMGYREQFAIMLRKTRKPLFVVCDDRDDLQDIIRMAALVRGSMDELKRKPLFAMYNEPSSPLVHTYNALDKLLACAESWIPTNYAPGGIAGGTTPYTAGATILLNNAECLFGLIVHQLQNPGAPFIYGYGNSPMDMRTMQAGYALPMAIQIQGGMCDMARFYGLPSWGEASSCSKAVDGQAVMEAAQFILMAALQGCNVTHDIAYLEFGLTYSLDFLVLVDEIIDRTKHIVKKVETNEEYLGLDAIRRVGHGGNYLGDEHTFNHLKENWRGDLSDFRSYEEWSKEGLTTIEQRANQKVKRILDTYEPVSLKADIDQEIENILNEARDNSRK